MHLGPLRRWIGRLERSREPLPDGELLARWSDKSDEAAFELLVRRHGGLVWGVCRRILPSASDAEDAFQATFLVLVRKAATVRRGQALAGWLHTTATRVALRARAARPKWSALADEPEGRTTSREDPELATALDREVALLPEKYREAFVACCLEGLSGEEAARRLGRPVGTVMSRLSRARDRLRQRLERRGLAPALAVTMEAVPAGLPATATALATGGAPSAAVAILTKGVVQAMFLTKLKTAAALVLTAVTLSTSGAVAYQQVGQGGLGGGPGAGAGETGGGLLGGGGGRGAGKGADNFFGKQAKTDQEIEIQKAKVERAKAELDASKAMFAESARRFEAITKAMERVKVNFREDDAAAAKLTATKYEFEVKAKEATLKIEELTLKHLTAARPKDLVVPGGPGPVPGGAAGALTLEQRIEALEKQVRALQKEVGELRGAQKEKGKGFGGGGFGGGGFGGGGFGGVGGQIGGGIGPRP